MTADEMTLDSMTSNESAGRLSTHLEELATTQREVLSIGEFVDEFKHHGIAFILILFSIPSAIPVPAVGYSTALSVPLMLMGFMLLYGAESVWLPQFIRKKRFDPKGLRRPIELLLRVVRFIEKFSKPRYVGFVRSAATRVFLGLLCCLLACAMAAPIPGTNTLPAGGLFLIGFSLLEDDGLLLLGGVLYSVAALAIAVLVLFLGYETVKYLLTLSFL